MAVDTAALLDSPAAPTQPALPFTSLQLWPLGEPEESREWPPLPAPVPFSPSTELCRLLNAAIIDEAFREEFLCAPAQAAARAEMAPGTAFGCPLPDSALRLPSIRLAKAEREVLRGLPRARSLAERWHHLAARGDRYG